MSTSACRREDDLDDPLGNGKDGCMSPALEILNTVVVLDAPDLETESAFWAAMVGGTVAKEADWHSIRVDDRPFLAVQLAPDHVAPNWPDGSSQQIHLDLWVQDIEESEPKVLALGGRPLKAVDEDNFRVYADPAGHPFCLCWNH